MINILGTYECKVDAKGRLMLPVQYKNQLGDETKMGFVIKRSIFKKCLELFPMAQWQLGKREEAQRLHGEAVEWMEEHKPDDEELRRFREEGAKLIGPEDLKEDTTSESQ